MRKVILIILDGWGIGKVPKADAIYKAKTPNIDGLINKFNNATLKTFGQPVGLPDGQMGNSEVGHLNIGAGRVVLQELARINNLANNNGFATNKILMKAADLSIKNNKPFHLMGLVSNGGIHSHINHLKALVKTLSNAGVPQIFIHAFTDGRDTDPKSGISFINELENFIKDYNAELVSVIGRYYAMDRDKRWPRIKKAYDLLTKGDGLQTTDFETSIKQSYTKNITDEFLEPIVKADKFGKAIGTIKEGDVLCCFNFRTDRCRQISEAITQKDFHRFDMKTLNIHYFTLTEYDKNFKNVEVILNKDSINNTLGEVIAKSGLKQLRVAETEKYPHVTFFFSGGREIPFEGEERILVNSPKVATYDLKPEMSAFEITQKLVSAIEENTFDFIIVNYANTDMVGHTGDFEAAKKAAETVDNCVERVLKSAVTHQYIPIIIADHGNAEFMINEDGSPNTAHTTNLVPVIVCDKSYKVKDGKLGDLAPSILSLMNLKIPAEMNGEIIIEKNV